MSLFFHRRGAEIAESEEVVFELTREGTFLEGGMAPRITSFSFLLCVLGASAVNPSGGGPAV